MKYVYFQIKNKLYYIKIKDITTFENMYIADIGENNEFLERLERVEVLDTIIKENDENREHHTSIMFLSDGYYLFSVVTNFFETKDELHTEYLNADMFTIDELFKMIKI